MKIDIRLFLLFICVIVIILLLHRSCHKETTTTVNNITVSRIDTLKVSDTVYFPKPYKTVELRIDTLYIDTATTIRDYYTDKYYLFAYQDSVLQANADVKISKNAIELAKFEYEIYRPTLHTTTVISEKSMQRFSLSLGVGINYNFFGKRAGIEVLTSFWIKRNEILFGYDFINQTPHLGWQYQIIRK